MTTIISGNWKMNGSKAMIDQWFEDFTKSAIEFESKNQIEKSKLPIVLLCIPDIYIDYAQKVAEKYNSKMKQFKVLIGAEDMHYEEKGAFTGNISPLFLNEMGCKYVLIGHSERRQYQKETDALVAKKSSAALAHNITPFVCFGEDLATREAGKHLEVIGEQLLGSTEGLDLTKIVISYEPVWAIGSGKIPTTTEIEEISQYIKDILKKARNVNTDELTIVYGGSVKASNAAEIIHTKNINGVLVGGASMKGEEFFGIVKGSF
ncbi:MAG: triose-phosphate isomerase [Rickettsiales bacterium]|nr:triose-phosphate isomerase [Rickettsiales bacterium]